MPLSHRECEQASVLVETALYLVPCLNDCGRYGQCLLLRRHSYLYAGCSCKAGEGQPWRLQTLFCFFLLTFMYLSSPHTQCGARTHDSGSKRGRLLQLSHRSPASRHFCLWHLSPVPSSESPSSLCQGQSATLQNKGRCLLPVPTMHPQSPTPAPQAQMPPPEAVLLADLGLPCPTPAPHLLGLTHTCWA